MKIIETAKNPYIRLFINFAYAIANSFIGIYTHSYWFIMVGAYYSVLSTNRFCVLKILKNSRNLPNTEHFSKRITGFLLVFLSFCVAGINLMAITKDKGIVFHEIAMVTIATYTFTKIIIAIIGMVKVKSNSTPAMKALRNISLADACVSVSAMQRSMLVSFQGMKPSDIVIMNILTGTAVWVIILFLGINLIGGKYTNMAKSKIVKANKKIASTVTNGYKKIETGVVAGYKKVENAVVNTYKKIEDKFVDAYLTKDGETIEEAKERLKKENK